MNTLQLWLEAKCVVIPLGLDLSVVNPADSEVGFITIYDIPAGLLLSHGSAVDGRTGGLSRCTQFSNYCWVMHMLTHLNSPSNLLPR
ncbi:hypothetical protein O9993_00700 [Vibrio lentus]|nr:hypothetical protein [Vibrio lentus]